MKPAMSIDLDLSAALAGLDAMTVASRDAVRPAAQAGAQIFYDEVKARAPVSKRLRAAKSGRQILPGALKASIYQVFSEDNSRTGLATYHVSWNARKAPHGHLVEFGTSRAPAHPFVRPSFDAVQQRALAAADAVYTFELQGLLA